MLKAGRKINFQRQSELLMELCDVAAIALCDGKYVDALKKIYRQRALYRFDDPKTRAMNAADPKTAKLVMAMLNGSARAGA